MALFKNTNYTILELTSWLPKVLNKESLNSVDFFVKHTPTNPDSFIFSNANLEIQPTVI